MIKEHQYNVASTIISRLLVWGVTPELISIGGEAAPVPTFTVAGTFWIEEDAFNRSVEAELVFESAEMGCNWMASV